MIKRGIGFSSAFQGANAHFGHLDISSVLLEVSDDDAFVIHTAASDVGQGLEATLFTIVSDVFGGLPSERVRWTWPTTKSPDGGVTGASRQTSTTGNALLGACQDMRELLRAVASEMLDIHPELVRFEGETVRGEKGRQTTLSEVIRQARSEGKDLRVLGQFSPPRTTKVDEHGHGNPINQFGYATCIVEVDVDTETGEVTVLSVSAYHDSGRILHPLGAEAQVHGGVVMGLGYATSEEYITENGKPVNSGFTNYLIPTVFDSGAPEIEVHFVHNPVPMGELGTKGLAEIPNTVIAPAICNAIFNATGAKITHLPATPERVFAALQRLENADEH